MRTSGHNRSSHSQIPWTWIIIIGAIIGIITLSSLSGSNSGNEIDGSALRVSPGSGSEVYIKPASGSAKQISESESFYTSDTSLSVANGYAQIQSSSLEAFLDKSSEMSYKEHKTDGESLELSRGRFWVESKGNNKILMKNLETNLKDGDIVMFEQPNQIFSTLYVLKGNVSIQAGGFNYVLTAGKKIMVSKSDLANPGVTLESLSGPIDDSIKQNALFILRNGESILGTTLMAQTESGMITGTGNMIGSGIIQSNGTRYIEITSPTDGTSTKLPSVDIIGKIFVKDVARITINDTDALVSPVDESFSYKGYALSADINNIVYKAYTKDGTLLEKGIVTVYAQNKQTGTDKLTPTNFPTNDKDYKITSPSENPYKTTDSSVTVSGVVPKNTVQYIMVNNFRLKKFIANSTSWYYYANTNYDTMKEGINLYEIKFYGTNNELLHTQLFTIVKESKSAVSGEVIQ